MRTCDVTASGRLTLPDEPEPNCDHSEDGGGAEAGPGGDLLPGLSLHLHQKFSLT